MLCFYPCVIVQVLKHLAKEVKVGGVESEGDEVDATLKYHPPPQYPHPHPHQHPHPHSLWNASPSHHHPAHSAHSAVLKVKRLPISKSQPDLSHISSNTECLDSTTFRHTLGNTRYVAISNLQTHVVCVNSYGRYPVIWIAQHHCEG